MRISGSAGFVVGIHRAGITLTESFGFRDVEKRLPMTPDTVVPIFSLTKLPTALAAQECIDSGLFKWNTPIDSILPLHFKDKKLRNNITIKACLSHSSGTSAPGLYRGIKNGMLISPPELVKFLESHIASDPERKFRYNNTWYKTIGYKRTKTTTPSSTSLSPNALGRIWLWLRTYNLNWTCFGWLASASSR